jgi:hypothetical protein
VSPNLPCRLNDKAELGDFIIECDEIALHDAAKPHCGLMARSPPSTSRLASSMRRFNSS